MNIAILGTGAIGSTFAYHLSKAGHAVTAIARGQREEQLRRDGAIVLVSGERAPVLWAMSRTQTQQDLGVLGPAEARMLIDMITAAAPGKTGALLAIRPE